MVPTKIRLLICMYNDGWATMSQIIPRIQNVKKGGLCLQSFVLFIVYFMNKEQTGCICAS